MMPRIALRVKGVVASNGDVMAAAPDGTLVKIGRRREPVLPLSLMFHGIQASVAARLRVSKSVVSRVANGLKKSRRIEKALLSEARRIERLIQKARVGEVA